MGGGSTKKLWRDIGTAAAVGGATAIGGPWAGAATWGAIRKSEGKSLIGSDIKPKTPDLPDLQGAPTTDSEEERLKQKALLDRIRRAAFTGEGRRATIATGGQGVTGQASLLRRTLTGIR